MSSYPGDLNGFSVIDMDSSAIIQVDGSELQDQLWEMQIMDQVVGLDQPSSMMAGPDVGQQPPPDPVEGTNEPGSLTAAAVGHQAEGGIQPSASSQTSREEATSGTSSGRRGRKRKSTDNEEGNKKLRQYERDVNDPNLTHEEVASIKNAKNAKRNRDKKNEELQRVVEERDYYKTENNNLKVENEELRAKFNSLCQELLQYQAREDAVRKLFQ